MEAERGFQYRELYLSSEMKILSDPKVDLEHWMRVRYATDVFALKITVGINSGLGKFECPKANGTLSRCAAKSMRSRLDSLLSFGVVPLYENAFEYLCDVQ